MSRSFNTIVSRQLRTSAGKADSHARAFKLHSDWLHGRIGALTLERRGFCPAEIDTLFRLRARVISGIHRLAGRDLVCWFPTTAPCHADTLLRLAVDFTAPRLAA